MSLAPTPDVVVDATGGLADPRWLSVSRGPGEALERCDPDAPPPTARTVVVPPSCVIARLQLRSGVVVDWPLPSDLTRAEVERLRRWLEVLPVEENP